MRLIARFLLRLAAFLLVALTSAPVLGAAAPERPRNLVIMIPDGCGPATVTLARMARGRPLSVDSLLTGTVETRSTSSRVTESAAAATAYATGVKTANRIVGLGPDSLPLTTIMESAKRRGMAIGLVVKSTITDATPAAFVAHVKDRNRQDAIAEQQITLGVDLLLGGGRERFLPSPGGTRRDGRDLVAEARAKGYTFVSNRGELSDASRLPLLGLFGKGNLPYAIDSDDGDAPGLVEMTRKALALLPRDPDGFVVMIEGSRVDHAAHANDPATMVRETLEFDDAVREVVAFARRDGRTLVVCVTDHETGGLTLGRRIGDKSPYETRPESLLAVRCSAERIADSIRAGGDVAQTIERNTGMRPDSDEIAELERLRASNRLEEAIGDLVSRRALLGWTTWGHTGVDVGLYAFGPGSERFRGVLDNAEVGRRLAQAMNLEVGRPRNRSAKR